MNKETFIEELKKLNITPTEKDLNKLDIYYRYLKEYNKQTNLTSIIEEEKVYLKHFYDSLTITKMLNFNEVKNVLDIGTGAGFPGMILKIFFPHLEVTLLDSNNKKITFLENLTKKLEITEGINIIKARSEEYIKYKREYFDVVTSRGVAQLKILSELSIPFTKVGGYFIPLKAKVEEELKNSEKIINLLGAKVIKKETFNLPLENSIRTILLIKKEKATPIKYPRSYNIIIKKNINNF